MKLGRRCNVIITPYAKAKWWSDTIWKLTKKADTNVYVMLGWAARQTIAKNALEYDIVMCIENDLFLTSRAITNYWCQYAHEALDANHHLQFIRFDRTPTSRRYPSGLMSFIEFRYTEVGTIGEIPNDTKTLHYYVNKTKQNAAGAVMYTWPTDSTKVTSYYIPLWILDKKRMKVALESKHWYAKFHARRSSGYRMRSRHFVREDAFIQIAVDMLKYPVVVGVRCPKNHKGSKQGCHIHPDAFIHHLPNNYGYNENFTKHVNPLSVDELYCLRPPCDDIT
eukprot:PhF_6_TR12647/c1_g1_i4/m.20065